MEVGMGSFWEYWVNVAIGTPPLAGEVGRIREASISTARSPVYPAVVLTGGRSWVTSTVWPGAGWPLSCTGPHATLITDCAVSPKTWPAKYCLGPIVVAWAGIAAARVPITANVNADAIARRGPSLRNMLASFRLAPVLPSLPSLRRAATEI